MSEEQKQCDGCGKSFPKVELIKEERSRDGKPFGTFFWCEDCLLGEWEDWEKEKGEKTIKVTLKGDSK